MLHTLITLSLILMLGSPLSAALTPPHKNCDDGLGAVFLEQYEPSRHPAPRVENASLTNTQVLNYLEEGLKALGYSDLKSIGAGGSGLVLRAKDRDEKYVVIKVPKAYTEADLHAFRAERDFTKMMSDVERNDAVKYFLEVPESVPKNVVASDGSLIPIIITKEVTYVAGGQDPARDLSSFSKMDFEMHPQLVEAVQKGLIAALRKLHGSHPGLIHRDVKPDNILVYLDEGFQPRIKLIDLGLSVPTQNVPQDQIGQHYLPPIPGIVWGTAGWLSPGQIRGQPATERDDVFNLRRINWLLRSGRLSRGDSGLVVRYLYPDVTSTSGERQSNAEKGAFTEPKVALDYKDDFGDVLPLRDRLVAMAEFSNWPSTIDEYEELQTKAKSLAPSDFMKWYFPKVLSLDGPASLSKGKFPIRYHAARELLNGTILSEYLDKELASGMSHEDLDSLVRAYYFLKAEGEAALHSPETLGPFGAHPYLNYEEFGKVVSSLRQRGLISDPEELQKQALKMKEEGYVYY